MCRAGLNFEVDFGINGPISTIVNNRDLILFGKWVVFMYNPLFK